MMVDSVRVKYVNELIVGVDDEMSEEKKKKKKKKMMMMMMMKEEKKKGGRTRKSRLYINAGHEVMRWAGEIRVTHKTVVRNLGALCGSAGNSRCMVSVKSTSGASTDRQGAPTSRYLINSHYLILRHISVSPIIVGAGSMA